MKFGNRLKAFWELYPQIREMDMRGSEFKSFFEIIKHFDDLKSIPTTSLVKGTMLLMTSTTLLNAIRPDVYDKYHHPLPVLSPSIDLLTMSKFSRLVYRFNEEEMRKAKFMQNETFELLHLDPNPLMGQRPFLIALHGFENGKFNDLVVSVRGSDNIEAIHMNCEVGTEQLPIRYSKSHEFAHSGAFKAADLLSESVYQFIKSNERELSEKAHRNIRIVFTGHSLGGSIAALASFMYRNRKSMPLNMDPAQILCFAYGAFPCVSPGAVRDSTVFDHVRMVVNGEDIIPRMRIEQIWRVAHALRLYSTKGSSAMLEYISNDQVEDLPFPDVYKGAVLPCKSILHINGTNIFDTDWKKFDSLTSSSLFLSSSMISHHLCSSYTNSLKNIFKFVRK